jgi:hypothetical protein
MSYMSACGMEVTTSEIERNQSTHYGPNLDLFLSVKLMLHEMIFNDSLHRNGLLNQSHLLQLNLHCESSLKIGQCNISFI